MRHFSFVLIFGLFLTGCSTLTTPVLRHQTGETLGTKRVHVFAHFASSRMFPLVPSGSGPSEVAQRDDVFQGSLLGFQGELGVMPKVDIQAGAFVSLRGGGWRVGSKYQVMKRGRLALAGMAGYGVVSSAGTIAYQSSGQLTDLTHTLSSYTFDFSAPVSYRISSVFVVYSGIMYLRSGVNGDVAGTNLSAVTHDLGANLGVRVMVGIFDSDLEIAYLRLYDPFEDGVRYLPYVGFSFGVRF